jgi:rare lipoprotein A (peptidoglycan hydrolase)
MLKNNDRGPFVGSRFPELSYGAAKDPGFAVQETAFVKIETMQVICSSARYTLKPFLNLEKNSP